MPKFKWSFEEMAKKYNSFLINQNTLHSLTRRILMIARCFGVFPLYGLLSPSSNNLRFIIKSPYTIIFLASVVGQCTLSILSLAYLSESGSTPRNFYKFIVNTAGAICSLIILRLAKHWPCVVQEAMTIEKSLPTFNQRCVGTPCKVAAAVIFSCALLEYLLSIRFYSRLAEACYQGNSLMESYYLYTMPSAAAYISFNVWKFVILQLIYLQIIFVTNFTDVLIIVISFYLSAYFEELNGLVNLYKDKSPSIWNVLRVHYTKLTRLVKLVDENISSFVLFSFGSNMALICVQIFKVLRKELAHETDHCDEAKVKETLTSLDRTVYFHFSILFLIARAVFTAFFATRVHTIARAPLLALYEVPSCCYSNEARRFVEQMHANNVALSGQHFFYVTRSMILTMVATVFTYELVLLQFSEKIDCK